MQHNSYVTTRKKNVVMARNAMQYIGYGPFLEPSMSIWTINININMIEFANRVCRFVAINLLLSMQ